MFTRHRTGRCCVAQAFPGNWEREPPARYDAHCQSRFATTARHPGLWAISCLEAHTLSFARVMATNARVAAQR